MNITHKELFKETFSLATLKDYLLIFAGCILIAISVVVFMTPNNVVSTGFAGIGMLFYFLWNWPVGVVTFLLNIPLFIAGLKWGGGPRFIVRTIIATFTMSLFIDVFQMDIFSHILVPVKDNPLIYTIFGGILDGVGVALVLRGQGSTGGTDIIAILLNRFRGVSFGSVFLVANTLILLISIPVVGLVPVLYALILNFISTKALDTVLEGPGYARSAFIISDQMDAIKEVVLKELGRGATILSGTGAFTGEQRPVLYVVVSRSQLVSLKRAITALDPRAFVVISDAHDVMGEGFKPL